MRFLKTTIICSFILLGFQGLANPDKEEELIRQTLMDYIEGTANGEPDRLRRAFHPDFNLYSTTKEDDLRIWKGEDYIKGIKPGKKNNRKGRIISIDREGITATAKVEIVIPDWRVFTDYFLLVKYQESWKIVHKSYSWRAFENDDKLSLANAELDTIFADFDRPDHPAVAGVAIHKGEVIFMNAFGSVDLDTRTPATVNTTFQLASLSRTFTGFAMLLLEEQGKLSLTDDIRKHLPSLPKYDETITINHLMSMTSGFPDFWPMSDLMGLSEEDVLTHEQVMNVISQLKPTFKPGTDYIYGHTDLVLLSEIISKVSGKSFADYMKEEVFMPLEMTNTVVVDSHNQLIPNMATSYQQREGGFITNDMNFGVTGPINVYSSVSDLAKWELNLLSPKLGSQKLVEKFHSECTTDDGEIMYSLFGQYAYSQQFYHWGHGVKEIYQMGNLGGHASAVFKFPDQDFTVIILSSGIPYSGYLGMHLAYPFIGDQFNDPEMTDFSKLKTKKISKKDLESFTGVYWNQEVAFARSIELENDTLRYVRGDGGKSALIPIEKNKFQMISGRDTDSFVTFETVNGEDVLNYKYGDASPLVFKKKIQVSYSENDLRNMAGKFYNETLNLVYELEVMDGQLIARHPRAGEIGLRPVTKNVFEATQWFFGSITFDEDQKGFMLNSENAKGLWFRRI